MIPKIIHYCWFGGNPLPPSANKCIESWKQHCPDFKIKRWDETNCDLNSNPYLKKAFQQKKWAFISDFMRLQVLYDEGGIYFDTDVELIQGLSEYLTYDCFFCFEDFSFIATGLGFGAIEGHPLIKEMLCYYIEMDDVSRKIEFSPCPRVNRSVFQEFGIKMNGEKQIVDNVLILSKDYMCPMDYKTGKIEFSENTISIHHYDSSWFSEEGNLRRKHLYRCIDKYGEIYGKIIYCIRYLGCKNIFTIIYKKIRNKSV